jgi:hypothetical protein
MPKQKFCDREKSAHKSSHDFYWSQIFQEEFLKANQKPLEQEALNFVRKTISLGVLLTFILLITMAEIQSAKISQAVQELDTKLVKQLMFLSN